MTLNLGTVNPVVGEPPLTIRDILRRSHGAFSEDWLAKKFRYDAPRAREIATAMQKVGYIRRDTKREQTSCCHVSSYSVTDIGLEMIRASAAKRIKRETATLALSEFMKRVDLVNASSSYLYSVPRVVLFGSFLGTADLLGDVDLAVELKSRIAFDREHKWTSCFLKHAWKSQRSFSSYYDELFWPRHEVLLVLKSRKRSISIQPWSLFVEMEKATNFRYKVLRGDAKEIRCELSSVRRNQ